MRPGVPALYKSSFEGQGLAPRISLRAHSREGASYHAYVTNPIQKPRPFWVFSNETVKLGERPIASRGPAGAATVLALQLKLENHTSVSSLVRGNQETPGEVKAFLDTLEDYAIFAPTTPVLRGIAPDTAPRNPVGLFGGQLPEAVGLMLNAGTRGKLLPKDELLQLIDWAKDFAVAEPSRDFLSASVPTMRYVLRFHDRFMSRKRNVLAGYDASEGALYVLFLLVLAVHPQSPRSFAIDNFDQALNPRAARALTRVFVEKALEHGRQAFLTTHSPLALDGLQLEDDRVRLFAVERARRDGQTKVTRITVDTVKAEQKLGKFPLSRLWVTGRLGGVPNV